MATVTKFPWRHTKPFSIRDRVALTGTRRGCTSGVCGVCTVQGVDGRAVLSCLALAIEWDNRPVTTIEGVAGGDELHPVQKAFLEYGAVQYGACTPGLIMTAKALLDENPDPDEEAINEALAAALRLSDGQVRIMSLNTGGGFTGRTSVCPHHYVAAVLSRKTSRPVKVRATADEEFIACRAGGEVKYTFRTGVSETGQIKAFEVDIGFDTGAYVESQMIVLTLTSSYMHSLYKIEASRYSGRLVHTNNIPYYFHHGGGLAQMAFGLGQYMDALARELGMDPADFHLLNGVTKGHTTMTGTFFGSCGLAECITKTAKQAGWKRKYGKLPPLKGIDRRWCDGLRCQRRVQARYIGRLHQDRR